MIISITGPMFSGKSTKLLEEYTNIIKSEENTYPRNILCFKPSKDKRDKTKIRARNIEKQIEAIVITKFDEILKYVKEDTKYIFIDEAQFINGNFNILNKLSIEKGIDIYVAGLNQTSEQRPFGTMPYILAISDDIYNLKPKCKCGKVAYYTYCKEKKNEDVLIGDKEYIPVCRKCLLKEKKGDK